MGVVNGRDAIAFALGSVAAGSVFLMCQNNGLKPIYGCNAANVKVYGCKYRAGLKHIYINTGRAFQAGPINALKQESDVCRLRSIM
jgi:hypothetical protein